MQRMRKTQGFADTIEYREYMEKTKPQTDIDRVFDRIEKVTYTPKSKRNTGETPTAGEQMEEDVRSLMDLTDIPRKEAMRYYVKNDYDFKKTMTWIYENILEDTDEEDSMEMPEEWTVNSQVPIHVNPKNSDMSKYSDCIRVDFMDRFPMFLANHHQELHFLQNDFPYCHLVNKLRYLETHRTFAKIEKDEVRELVAEEYRMMQKYQEEGVKIDLDGYPKAEKKPQAYPVMTPDQAAKMITTLSTSLKDKHTLTPTPRDKEQQNIMTIPFIHNQREHKT